MMRTMLVLLGMSFSGFVMGQTNATDGWLKDTANLSAVGALITALGFLLKIYIPARDVAAAEQQKGFTATLDKMADRHSEWEKVRHEDSETLHATLMMMTKNCAEAQAAMRVEGVSNVQPRPPGG